VANLHGKSPQCGFHRSYCVEVFSRDGKEVMGSQGPGQLKDMVEDQCRVTKSVDPARVVPFIHHDVGLQDQLSRRLCEVDNIVQDLVGSIDIKSIEVAALTTSNKMFGDVEEHPCRSRYWKSDGEEKSSNEVPSADEAKIIPVSKVQELKKSRKGNSSDGGDSIENMLLVDILNHQLHLEKPEEEERKNDIKEEVL